MEEYYLVHHGIEGQIHGVRNGPPYPLKKAVSDAIKAGRNAGRNSISNSVTNTVMNPARQAADGKKPTFKVDGEAIAKAALMAVGTAVVGTLVSKGVNAGADALIAAGKVAASKAVTALAESKSVKVSNMAVNAALDIARKR